ncbi:hypothetical protein ACIBI4_12760 [Streptomyces sp. NPDC050418]|uniref:hypothetical protein n=1 Tax=Streptomyces sp. NPDC050418 TaxID=3365612 RepID=UPI0037A52D77
MTGDERRYAHHETLEGLLQRGRGLGSVRARNDPAAAVSLVDDGIRRDWTWEGFVDERALYQAQLVLELRMPQGPLVEQLHGSEEECARAADVLVLLAPAGSDEARDGLRTYLRDGVHWIEVLESLALKWPEAWWADLGGLARSRISREPEHPWLTEPWTRFGIEPRQPAPRPARQGLSGHTIAELLGLLTGSTSPSGRPGAPAEGQVRTDALRELCRREPAEGLIPLVPGLSTADDRHCTVGLQRAVDHLGALAVPAARVWANSPTPWLARLGRGVLADQLVPEALPVLLSELAGRRRSGSWCGPAVTAERLARFGREAAPAAGVLRWLWTRTPHSYERPAYLKALAAIDPSGLDFAYTESLWDCQEQARLLGIAHAPRNPATRERIEAMRDDPMESSDVRSAAAAALEPGAHGPPED